MTDAPAPSPALADRVARLLDVQGIVDGHDDLAWALRERAVREGGPSASVGDDVIARLAIEDAVPGLHTDLPRLARGRVAAQFWSVWVPDLPGVDPVRSTIEQIDVVRRLVAAHPDRLALAVTADDVERVVASGRIASLMGMEGGHSIGGSLGALRTMRALGVRYMTLTHNANVAWADSATDAPVHHGLSPAGERVVAEMERIGMLVDLSHVSADVMRHALRIARRPVLFSHSGARAECDVPRNVPDDVLATLPANGGVCMATFVPQFVSPAVAAWHDETLALAVAEGVDPRDHEGVQAVAARRPGERATLADVVRHVERIREVAGARHVGLGGDYDGVDRTPDGLEDVSRYPALIAALAELGWSDDDLRALAGGNALRVLRAADADDDVSRGAADAWALA
ncbi:Membrane dipeptidase (Peptidase family M19) [Clavibacter michiganensis subsp. michiganensis]|uniref:dipeptidase n=1 Tax=Clavibacter michiganensis TaxID=28447 RepID=UPI000B637CAF|nr:dipeptidase [Clavibacter michiganensis]OUE03108.1 Membrane dipeptidase (Peptidase family M19) [Clavibacter michiganensis subsp. michiganensis]